MEVAFDRDAIRDGAVDLGEMVLQVADAALVANAVWRVGSAYVTFYKFKDAVNAEAARFMCPKCGGRLNFDVHKADLACPYCGYIQETEEDLAADDEESIDFILPTTRGHRWAEAQRHLSCENCGATSLLPSGQKSDQCPYCGANRMVESAEDIELVDPQAIALMKLDAKDAAAAVKKWLAKGWLAPDDLAGRQCRLRLGARDFHAADGFLIHLPVA